MVNILDNGEAIDFGEKKYVLVEYGNGVRLEWYLPQWLS